MQWTSVILNNDNWALASSEHKDVLLWAIKDKPWLVVRSFGFETAVNKYPCLLKSKNWREADIVSDAESNKLIMMSSVLLGARVKLLTELKLKINAHKENLGINDSDETIIQFYKYLASISIINDSRFKDCQIDFENKIKLLIDLENIKLHIINLCLLADSKEKFADVRTEMDRLLFTNILL
jgi:hypothetical protein